MALDSDKRMCYMMQTFKRFSSTPRPTADGPSQALSGPDSTYGLFSQNGYIWSSASEAPTGAIPLFLYFNADIHHHMTVACQEGLQYAHDNGFALNTTLGYILPW